MPLSIVVFVVAVLGLYAWTRNPATSAPELPEDHIEPPREMAPR
jgi:hypothetical protein